MTVQKNSAAEADTTNQRNFIKKRKNYQGSTIRKIIDFVMFLWLYIAVGGADSLEPLPLIIFFIPPFIWLINFIKRSNDNV